MGRVRGRTRAVARRLVGVCLASLLVGGLASGAGAVTKGQVEAAKARVEALQQQINQAEGRLHALQEHAAVVAEHLIEKRYEYDAITAQLRETQRRLADARARYSLLQDQLDARAREYFMQGPAGSLDFLLGAATITDLSDRLEFVGAVTQSDLDLANEVTNLRNLLGVQQEHQGVLQDRAADAIAEVQAQREEVLGQIAEAADLVAQIEAKKREAVAEAAKVSREYENSISGTFGGVGGSLPPAASGTFKYCPVGPGHIVTNSFGAPRVGHLHMGDDIMAPYGTPIYAPFDGNATSSSSSLGGLQVYVYGADGYVFNAHLSRVGQLGSVSAGTVMGYVGTSGNAQGGAPHDHFEWHPKVIPSSWPASPYGYSVIGSAVNPYPLLTPVC